jgi:hypothetical protein
MSMIEKAVTNRGPKKRDPTCLEVRYDITIPAGTILRQEPGKAGTFVCVLAGGRFVIENDSAAAHEGSFRRVIAA